MTDQDRPSFTDCFEVVFSYAFEKDSFPKKTKIGTRDPQWCRFCDRDEPVFRGDSHVIPAGLGNRSLFSLEECKDCNDPWGSDIEDNLAKYLFLMRAVARIRKRKGGVKYKRAPGSKSSVASNPEDNLVRVEIEAADDSVKMEDLGDNTMLLTAQGQPYSPMKAVKALARLGLFVLEKADYDNCDHVVRWLRGEAEYLPYFIRAFVPGSGRRLVRLRVYRRVCDDIDVAPFLVHLSYSSVDLLFPFPNASLKHPELPVAPFPGFSPYPPHIPSAKRIDVLSDAVIEAPEESVTLKYRSKVEVEDLEVISENRAAADQSAGNISTRDFPSEAFEAGVRGFVDVVLADHGGRVLFQTPASIELEQGDDPIVWVRLQGERIAWSLRVPLVRSGSDFTYEVPSKQGAPIPDASEVFSLEYALRFGATLEARDRRDHAPILYTEYNAPPLSSSDAQDLDSQRRLYERLLIIEKAFPGILRMPTEITPKDVRTIEFLSTAVDVGEFEDTPRPTYSVPMNSQSVAFLEDQFSGENAPQGLKAPVHALIQLFGVDINPGPWFVALARPRLTAPLDEVVEALRGVPQNEMVMVEMTADQCIVSFEQFLQGETASE
jgi:hypothetical protein